MTLALGLGIGRLVFAALDRDEVVLAAAGLLAAVVKVVALVVLAWIALR